MNTLTVIFERCMSASIARTATVVVWRDYHDMDGLGRRTPDAVMGVGAMGGALATRGRERGALLFAAGTVVGVEKFTRCARLQLPSFVIGERYASAGRSSALDFTRPYARCHTCTV